MIPEEEVRVVFEIPVGTRARWKADSLLPGDKGPDHFLPGMAENPFE